MNHAHLLLNAPIVFAKKGLVLRSSHEVIYWCSRGFCSPASFREQSPCVLAPTTSMALQETERLHLVAAHCLRIKQIPLTSAQTRPRVASRVPSHKHHLQISPIKHWGSCMSFYVLGRVSGVGKYCPDHTWQWTRVTDKMDEDLMMWYGQHAATPPFF